MKYKTLLASAVSALVGSVLAGPLWAQKLFFTPNAGYGFTNISRNYNSDTDLPLGTIKTEGGWASGMGIGANYGQMDILYGWQYNQVNFKKLQLKTYTQNRPVDITLKNSGVFQHNFTIGGQYHPQFNAMVGILQPFFSAQMGLGYWTAQLDNGPQTNNGYNIKESELFSRATGIKLIYGLGMGVDIQATSSMKVGLLYQYNGNIGEYSVKDQIEIKHKINSSGVHLLGGQVKMNF